MIRDDMSRPRVTTEVAAWMNAKASAHGRRANWARQASGRRRLIDPTTCDRDYSGADREFMVSMHFFDYSTGKASLTCREVFVVAVALGNRNSGVDAQIVAGWFAEYDRRNILHPEAVKNLHCS